MKKKQQEDIIKSLELKAKKDYEKVAIRTLKCLNGLRIKLKVSSKMNGCITQI